MTYKTSELVMRISLIIFILFLGITVWLKTPVFAGIGVVIAMAGMIQTLIYHRCPNCEKFINPFINGEIKFCPYCGEKFGDE